MTNRAPNPAFDKLRHGLEESIAHARGELTLNTTTLAAPAPPRAKTPGAAIRKKPGVCQAVVAALLKVPPQTLQSWEQGARTPKAGEARLLQIAEADPERFAELITGSRTKRPARGRKRSTTR